jgi:outer membrane lipoprotein-sorting protein
MKKITTVICAAAVSLCALAQDANPAKELLDKFANKMKSHKSITAKFSFTLVNKAEDINDKYDGEIVLQNNMYKVNLMGATAYCDGNIRWTHMVEEGDVNISEPDADSDDVMENPDKIFTIYEKGFKYKKQPSVTNGNKTLYVVDLFPKNRDNAYSRVRLIFDSKTFAPDEIIYYAKDGNNYVIDIKSFNGNKTYPKNFFIFDKTKHPDVEMVDLR